MTPREIIEDIRREEYGIDENAPPQEQRRLKIARSRQNRTLKVLSEDLYSKETHFVLELIQNADDNKYQDGVVPKLRFDLSSERLLVINNELGFKEEHVRALCDVAKSTKKEKKGYIGEKGIGFKSVFNFSDAPEIHSNGYHFCFDRTGEDDLLGYVVPKWREPSEPLPPNVTTIILPAKPEKKFGTQIFEDVDARLVLFLSKLKIIELCHEDSLITFRRHDKDGYSKLVTTVALPGKKTTNVESRFLRVSTEIPMHGASDEKRPGINNAEMVLAFRVDDRGAADPQPSSQVFAFLPIRPVGFKFEIHSDFVVSASREDIHTERPWNKRLRDSIATVFVEAIESFKKHESLAFTYLAFLPRPNEIVDPFFQKVRPLIFSALAKSKCLPSAGGEWKTPRELRYGGKVFQKLFPSPVAQKLFGFDYVHPRLDADEQTLTSLGVKPVTLQDVVGVFSSNGEWLREQDLEWKGSFYAYLSTLDRKPLLSAGLKSSPCIPLTDGRFVSPMKTRVFYPLSRGKRYGFEDELSIIDAEILDKAYERSERSERVDSLFFALGVKKDDPYEMLKHHILPKHAGEEWQLSRDEALVGHLRYIKDKWKKYLEGALREGESEEAAIEAISNGLWIGTKDRDERWSFDRAFNLYYGKEYTPAFSIESLLGDSAEKCRFISPEYLTNKSKEPDAEVESWRTFLSRLGVSEAPKVVSQFGNFVAGEELTALLGSPKSSVRRATLECLDRHWAYYIPYLKVEVAGRRHTVRGSGFANWLPLQIAPTSSRKSIPLKEAFYPSQEMKDVLGDSPIYVNAKLNRTELLEACQLTFRIDAAACLKRLRQLKEEEGDTIPQIQKIYRHLERLWESDGSQISYAFDQEGLIRVKGPHAIWARPNEVAWRSSTPFLDSLYPPLIGQYPDFSGFFVKKLSVSSKVPTEAMVKALPRIIEIESLRGRIDEAVAIYKRASGDLAQQDEDDTARPPDWLEIFETESVFLDQRGELVDNDESLYANDSPELGKLFEDEESVSLWVVPFDELPRVRALIEAVGVRSLAQAIRREVVEADGGRLREDLTQKLHTIVPLIARCVYARNHAHFESAIENKRFECLIELRVIEVPDLKLRASLAEVSRTTAADIVTDGSRILLNRGIKLARDLIAIEVCKILEISQDLADTISRLLVEDEETAEELLRIRGIGKLPPDLEKALLGLEDDPDPDEESGDNTEISDPAGDSESKAEETKSESETETGGEQRDRPEEPESSPHPKSSSNRERATSKASEMAGSESGDSEARGSRASPASTDKPEQRERDPAHEGAETPSTPQTRNDRSPTERRDDRNGVDDESAVATHSQGSQVIGKFRSRRSGRHPEGRRAKSGRLMSYADSPEAAERAAREESPDRVEARKAVERAAVEYFLKTHSGRWKSLIEMEHDNAGFDIRAVSIDDVEEFIEVKGQSGAWTEAGVALTRRELEEAHKRRERYWLCVVEFATDENRRRSFLVKNPFGLTREFRFDSGWKTAALLGETVVLAPAPGLIIEIPETGTGRIVSVRKKGAFYKLHVKLDSGGDKFVTFNPAKMSLRGG